ncbi:MAG: sensor histidine kinase [Acidobacteriaceae bacterium]
MNVDKENRRAGTVCITDRRESAEHPEQSRQTSSGTYVMSKSKHTADIGQSAGGTGSRLDGDRALETLGASQKLIHMGRMAASIAHEVNNPLESITNLLYLLRAEPGLSQSALAYLDLAEREMERVVTITRQTLTFARETAEPVELSLTGLLEEVLLLHRRHILQKQLRVIQRYSPTEPVHVYPGEIRQVLSNLIVNAIEASANRGAITLRIRPALAQNVQGVRITIADNGTGIPPQVRSRLGEPFFTTKGQGGTGLGLWVSRSIVEHYGGKLRMRSTHISEPFGKTRHGTVFTLFLPRNATQAPSGSASGSRPTLVPRSGHSPRERSAPSLRRTMGAD